nr:ORF4a [Bat coronavirus]
MLLLNVTTIIGCMLTATIHSNYLSISADTLERVDFYLASGGKVCQHSHSFNPTKYKCENNTLSVFVFAGYKQTFEVRCFVKDSFESGYVSISESSKSKPNIPLLLVCSFVAIALSCSFYF